jgi:hypothetical protein
VWHSPKDIHDPDLVYTPLKVRVLDKRPLALVINHSQIHWNCATNGPEDLHVTFQTPEFGLGCFKEDGRKGMCTSTILGKIVLLGTFGLVSHDS